MTNKQEREADAAYFARLAAIRFGSIETMEATSLALRRVWVSRFPHMAATFRELGYNL